jgi:hypothetical protein
MGCGLILLKQMVSFKKNVRRRGMRVSRAARLEMSAPDQIWIDHRAKSLDSDPTTHTIINTDLVYTVGLPINGHDSMS